MERPQTYRFKFTDVFMALLSEFARKHRYETAFDFRNSWTVWLPKNTIEVEREKNRLANAGYKGDIYDKMYKSVRYYLRNKSDEKKTPKKRRKYRSFCRVFLEDMDLHITKVAHIEKLKPAHAFNNFYGSSSYNKEMEREKTRLMRARLEEGVVENKIKKTYKNRYFILQQKMHSLD